MLAPLALFHTNTAVDGVTLPISEGAVLDDGDGSTKGEDAADPLPDPEVI